MEVKVMIDLTARMEQALRDLCAVLKTKREEEVANAPIPPKDAPAAKPATSAPVAAPVCADPVQPAPAAVPAPEVPLSRAPSFTKGQVASAGAALLQADPGKKEPLQALLAQYGVPSVADLPEEHIGAFATALRGLGANI